MAAFCLLPPLSSKLGWRERLAELHITLLAAALAYGLCQILTQPMRVFFGEWAPSMLARCDMAPEWIEQ